MFPPRLILIPLCCLPVLIGSPFRTRAVRGMRLCWLPFTLHAGLLLPTSHFLFKVKLSVHNNVKLTILKGIIQECLKKYILYILG